MLYNLKGRFIECCNCRAVCPCWVDDLPTEDHCTGFFAWTFEQGSMIEGHDVGDRHLVVVTVHSDKRRGGASESALFADRELDPVAAEALLDAFDVVDDTRRDPIAELRSVLGYGVARERATIAITEIEETDAAVEARRRATRARRTRRLRRVESVPHPREGFEVRVRLDGQELISTRMFQETFDDSLIPLTLTATALDREMGTHGGVTAHRTEELVLRVSSLSGAGTELYGRSGMVGRFEYADRSLT